MKENFYNNKIDRPPITDRIKSIDFYNLSEEDEKIISECASEYFIENYSSIDGVQEQAEKLKNSILFLSRQEFEKILDTADDEDTRPEYPIAFYDENKHAIFFCREVEEDNSEYNFSTIMHEAFHFVGIENGAGFSTITSSISIPEEINENEEDYRLLSIGANALCEGMTNLFSVNACEKMGFDFFNSSYEIETSIANRINIIVGSDQLETAFFSSPLEEIRLKFEAIKASPEELNSSEDYFNGCFSYLLISIGDCAIKCNELLKKFESTNNESYAEQIVKNLDSFEEEIFEYYHT